MAFSPALFAAGWITVYNETELWAFTLALIGVTSIVEWGSTGFIGSKSPAVAASAALAATLTRAPVGLGVAVALGSCGVVLAWRSRSQGLRAGRWAVLGGALPLVAHAAINHAKFGSWFSVPGRRQVMSLDVAERAAWFAGNNDSFFSACFLTTTALHYLRPDAVRFERLVPGIRFGPLAQNRASYPLLGNTPASSLTVTATLLFILAVVGAVWLVRHRAKLWSLAVVCTAIGTLPTFMIGFVANRYLIDMLPPLVLAGAIGVWVLSASRVSPAVCRAVRIGAVALVVWGAWVNVSLATWTLNQKSPGFTDLRYRVDDLLFPAPSPGLIRLDATVPVARDGVVGLDVDQAGVCRGIYTAEQGVWVGLERDGSRRRVGTVEPDRAPGVLARGEHWRLEYERAGPDGASVSVYEDGADRIDGSGDPVFATVIEGIDGRRPVPFEVVADPVSEEYYVRIGETIGGTVVLLPHEPLRTGPIVADGVGMPSPSCERLLDRL